MSGVTIRLVKRWIAGDKAKDAISVAKNLNKRGIEGIINYLGEHSTENAEIRAAVKEYFGILTALERENVKCCISVKPTQFGLLISPEYCQKNIEEIVAEAKNHHKFVWMDMEGSRYTQATINMYLSLHKTYPNVGICLQAYMKRTEKDMKTLLANDAIIRLCKGAYNEPKEIVFKSKSSINKNFLKLTKILFEHGTFFALGTHDDNLIATACELSRKYGRDFEFQMLRGIRNELETKLVRQGFKVKEYIPYGSLWIPYVIRRVSERKQNIVLILRSALPTLHFRT